MAKERKASSSKNAGDYEVGYGRPPRHSRFPPGESGNPRGRRRGLNNFLTDLRRALRVPVKVKEGGRWRKMSTQEAALMLLRETALQNGARALERLLELACRLNNEPDPVERAPLSTDDEAILAAYVQKATRTVPSQTIPSKSRPRRRRLTK
jgi:hypothetical protein